MVEGEKDCLPWRPGPLFVAAFPNAVIKNNNADNGVPSSKQWQERPTSARLRNGIHAPAVWPSSGYSTRRF